MPTVAENKRRWASHAWREGGDEWSTLAGGSARWWHGILLPRLMPILAALPERAHVLEIGPGHGRWTRFLLDHAREATLLDLDEGCLDACVARFGQRVRPVLGDGWTFSGDAARVRGPVDFVFSYDSLVHAEIEALGSYLREMARVLRPGGFAFLHHSNLGAFVGREGKPAVSPTHWRATSADAAGVRSRAVAAGLGVPLQELCTKGGPNDRAMIDCITLLRKPEVGDPTSTPGGATMVLENLDFWQEIQALGRAGRAYDAAVDPLHRPAHLPPLLEGERATLRARALRG
ncbi:MAG: class I SAM-dependent methyltransferase [Planctomycetota bacterium]